MQTVALAGNPNSGKTTLFNELTGARQHVGNYPGVTVEKKSGRYRNNGKNINIVDLPGTYSLTAYSLEEVIARDFLTQEKPKVVIDIVDASNLERHLYLAIQFLELGVPLVICLNMIDTAKERGIEINSEKLSTILGVPVIPTIARTGYGKKELIDIASECTQKLNITTFDISYGEDLDKVIDQMVKDININGFLTDLYPAKWVALKYLEKDGQVLAKGKEKSPELSSRFEDIVKKTTIHMMETIDTDPEAIISDYRYGFIQGIMKQGVVKRQHSKDRIYASDRIDRVLTNRFAGPIIMLAVIVGLYQFTFTYSEVPVGWLENFFGWLGGKADALIDDGFLKSLVISGIIDGVGGVLGFVPIILFMFLGISVLEDSGYLARVAYMLDRVFRVFGLHGSSVMPFIVSGGIAGGCAVPGVMATRTLRSPKERLATLLTVPFMNCGAKMPVFALLVASFFSKNEAFLMFLLTIISWTVALLAAKALRLTVIKGAPTPFVMELPPYRLPTFKGLLIHTWVRTWQYIKKAGTVILSISIILWAMMTFPGLPESQMASFDKQREALKSAAGASLVQELNNEDELSAEARILKNKINQVDAARAEASLRHSIAGRFGIFLENVTKNTMGTDWRTDIALVGGFAAKEVIVSTLGTSYSLGEVDPKEADSLSRTLAASTAWSPLVAWSLMIFIMFYSPCFVTVVAISREAGSWKWAVFSMVFNTILAFILATCVYQAGILLGY